MNHEDRDVDVSGARRRLLKMAAVGVGLGVLPGTGVLAATGVVSKGAVPSISLGYLAPGAKSIVDAYSVASGRGMYQLSVIGSGVQSPFALAAQYSAIAAHRFWQAWSEQGMLQRSSPITIRFASSGSALPVNITLPNGTLTADIPARPGIYALALVPATQRVLPWSSYALAMHSGGDSMKLVPAGSKGEAALNYALFEVDRV